jgi:hypothetical protein
MPSSPQTQHRCSRTKWAPCRIGGFGPDSHRQPLSSGCPRNPTCLLQFDRLKLRYEQESSAFHEQLAQLKQQVGREPAFIYSVLNSR